MGGVRQWVRSADTRPGRKAEGGVWRGGVPPTLRCRLELRWGHPDKARPERGKQAGSETGNWREARRVEAYAPLAG